MFVKVQISSDKHLTNNAAIEKFGKSVFCLIAGLFVMNWDECAANKKTGVKKSLNHYEWLDTESFIYYNYKQYHEEEGGTMRTRIINAVCLGLSAGALLVTVIALTIN